MKVTENKKFFSKLLLVGIFLIVVQTMFQNMDGFLNVVHGALGYVRPFIYAVFMAILFDPLVELIEKKTKRGRGLSIFLSLLLIVLILMVALFWFIPNLIESFEDIIKKFPAFQDSFNEYLGKTFDFLREKKLVLLDGQEIRTAIENFFVKNMNNIRDMAISLGFNIAGGIFETFILFFGAFLGIYIVYDKESFVEYIKNIILIIWGPKASEDGFDFLVESKNIFLNYMLGRLTISLIVGIISYIGMKVTGVPYALINSVMIGVGNMIPFFGPFISGLVSLILVFLSIPIKCISLIVIIFIGQLVDGYILGPKILGKSVGLSGFWIIASVIIMGNVMGTIGMFLGVPIFAILRLIYLKVLKRKKQKLLKP